MGNAIVQQQSVRQIGEKVVLGQIGHFEHHGLRLTHIVENHHGADNLSFPGMNRGGGIFNGRFTPIPPDEDTVRD